LDFIFVWITLEIQTFGFPAVFNPTVGEHPLSGIAPAVAFSEAFIKGLADPIRRRTLFGRDLCGHL